MLSKTKNKKQRDKKSFVKEAAYPYIIRKDTVLNGSPVILGTRVPVKAIAGYYQMGMNVDEILNTLTHLTPSQVHSALAYYFDHQKDIDKEIYEDNYFYQSTKTN